MSAPVNENGYVERSRARAKRKWAGQRRASTRQPVCGLLPRQLVLLFPVWEREGVGLVVPSHLAITRQAVVRSKKPSEVRVPWGCEMAIGWIDIVLMVV
jgi:hypothetical protein